MRYALAAFFLICQFAGGALEAGAPEAPPVFERWDTAFLDGMRAGYVRTAVTPKTGGQMQGIVELRLQIRRINDIVQFYMDTGTFETAEGTVTGVFTKQLLGRGQEKVITGKVDGTRLLLTLDKTIPMDPAPWDSRVIGVARQQRLFQERKIQPGDQFTYKSFEPSINLVVNLNVEAKDFELVELLPGAPKQKLLRVEVKADKVQIVQLPTLTIWLNEDRAQMRSDVDIPGMGKMKLVKSTREKALAPGAVASQTVETSRIVPLKVRLPLAHDMAAATYRIRIKDQANPEAGFSADNRQSFANSKGDTFEMTVRRAIVAPAEKARPEYLESSYFINSADAMVRDLARLATAKETDPWKKAVKIEQYVKKIMKSSGHEVLATADRVARTHEGDCTEYAMLTAAMCRAEGVPSRTAIGLVYGEVRGQPAFVFHMWTEVWVRGQWLGLDATLGRGGIGAAHLKVSDQSWQNENSMTPLLPTLNLLGRVSVEVLRAE